MATETGNEIRRLREALGLSQAEAARRAQIAQPNLSACEAGKLPLSAAMCWRLAGLYGPQVFSLCESGELLREVPVTLATPRRELDVPEEGLRGFVLPGGLRVLVPRELARGLGRRQVVA